MRRGLPAGLAALAWLAGVASSCSGVDVTLATLPVSAEGGASLGCRNSDDCLPGQYCDKPSCSSLSGTCEGFPPQCGNDENPVCGCDGITYFNDCLRTASGVAASTAGACQVRSALTCGGSMEGGAGGCPPDAVCGQLGGTMQSNNGCPSNPGGICWLLPSTCPSPSHDSDLWDSCGPAPGQGLHCVDTCTALLAGGAYQRTTASSNCH